MSFLYDEDNPAPVQETSSQIRIQSRQKNPILEPAQCRVDQECHAALSQSLRVAAQTNQLAQLTAEELQAQTEQIQRIHRDSEATHYNLKTSEFLLKGMKSWWNSLTQLFQEAPKVKSTGVMTITRDPEDKVLTYPAQADVSESLGGKDMSTDLSNLSLMLEEMKHRAIATGRELEFQTKELEIVHELTVGNDEMLDKQRRALDKLMN